MKHKQATRRRAMRILDHASEHLRPRMQGDSLHSIPMNAEAEAGSILASRMVMLSATYEYIKRRKRTLQK